MSRIVYLVLGAEGSGTTLLTRMLESAGCKQWSPGVEGYDWRLADAAPDAKVVCKRTLPHGGGADRGWPDLDDIAAEVRDAGFDLNAIVISRLSYCAARSQVRRGFSPDVVSAGHAIAEAERRIWAFCRRGHWWAVQVSYESIVHNFPVVKAMLGGMGLDLSPWSEPINDGNEKYR